MNTKQNHTTHTTHTSEQKCALALLARFALLILPMTVMQSASASSELNLLSQPQSTSVAQIVASDEQRSQTAQATNTLSELQINKLEQQRLKQTELQSQQIKGRASVEQAASEPLTREQIIQSHIDKAMQANQDLAKSGSVKQFANGIYRDFYIYDAYSRLFVDNDYDGFYQTFSVTFDADVEGYYANERANVFAELYLSRNGGPWEHYYTTDIFTIFGNATDDDFEVLTTLESGYRTDHYDVLIDLYEVGYGDIVTTVSSNDFDSLYALPLESSDRDDVYIEEDYHGGSVSLAMLLILLALLCYRNAVVLKTGYDSTDFK
ncbi:MULTISPECIES: choice-of-anchor H family protein [unclassified Shewanella]|uniref:choice-of-anchor H family protein n=1 Tax=unclassified Shewanella TaxID=196818 RepID=UPI001BBC893B|nr:MULTISPECIES: choice-of-anchor H family protein [unclassified Shewanella]GIU21479.1 GlyGly-CTERM sorting domain-containing protein [Shewanella sp. MBTL60-112-B1]GIU27707.1 GlyGly-CTERM sorting domain-containing protein [Shewanella sp. MBTL60-112-B2]